MRTLAIIMAIALACCCALNAGAEAVGAKACEKLLDAAEASGRHLERGEETIRLYSAAFEQCGKTDLSPDLAARVAAKRGDVLLAYENDPERALAVFEQGLAEITAAGGLDHPARIALLEGVAETLEGRVLRGKSAKPASDEEKSLNLRKEALELRKAVYGERSAEFIRGLNVLAFAYLDRQPTVAEELAKQAVEITISDPALTESAAESYSTLAAVYEALGQEDAEEAARERAGELFDRIYPPKG